MVTQPQLIGGPRLTDVVYTPDWVAKDMVSWFKPAGKVLEPCRGGDAIYRYLPVNSDWCEIEQGRDFFSWHQKADWIISNPPFSAAMFNSWLEHSYDLAPDIVYLLPIHFVFRSASKLEIVKRRGWMKQVRFYGTGAQLNFPMGNPIAAIHFQRGYHGPTEWTWYTHANKS